MERLARQGIRLPVLCHERLFANSNLDHDGPERCSASGHELDQSSAEQRRSQRCARLELGGIEEGRRDAAGNPEQNGYKTIHIGKATWADRIQGPSR